MQLLSEVTWKNGETLGSLGPALGCELTGTAALAKLKHHSIWIAKTPQFSRHFSPASTCTLNTLSLPPQKMLESLGQTGCSFRLGFVE